MSETSGRCRRTIDAMDAGACVEGMRCDHIIADAIDRLAADVAAVKEAVCDGSVAAAIRQRDEARAAIENLKESRDAANRLYGATLAEVERLKAELAARPAANSPVISDSSPAAPQPAAPPPGWLTDEERRALSSAVHLLFDDDCDTPSARTIQALLARAGSPPPGWLTGEERAQLWFTLDLLRRLRYSPAAEAVGAILSRAGSPPSQTAPWWLTDEERAEIKHLLLIQRHNTGWTTERHAELDALLARAGSPPVVVLPTVFQHSSLGDKLVALQQVKDAMDAAGVAWKEVGRE